MGLMDAKPASLEISQFQNAFALTVQVLNTVSVPQGNQYGTDSGETSGEGRGYILLLFLSFYIHYSIQIFI